jgi:hypothetical protein
MNENVFEQNVGLEFPVICLRGHDGGLVFSPIDRLRHPCAAVAIMYCRILTFAYALKNY